jgi:hypothetical protein
MGSTRNTAAARGNTSAELTIKGKFFLTAMGLNNPQISEVHQLLEMRIAGAADKAATFRAIAPQQYLHLLRKSSSPGRIFDEFEKKSVRKRSCFVPVPYGLTRSW